MFHILYPNTLFNTIPNQAEPPSHFLTPVIHSSQIYLRRLTYPQNQPHLFHSSTPFHPTTHSTIHNISFIPLLFFTSITLPSVHHISSILPHLLHSQNLIRPPISTTSFYLTLLPYANHTISPRTKSDLL